MRNDWAAYIRANAPKYGVDPDAALRVAQQEGLSGRVGDGGHAFGAFQLNDAGGVLTGRPGNHQAFAESTAGLDWALAHIGQVARGLHGRAAVEAIVRRFERPADPNGEVNRALGGLAPQTGGYTPQAPTAAPFAAPLPQQPARPDGHALLNMFSQLNDIVGLPTVNMPLPPPPTRPAPTVKAPSPRSAAPPPPGRPAGDGTPAPHKGSTLTFLEHFAKPYGVTITSTTGGKHATHSYHYQGRAIDVAGPPSRMAAVAEAALRHPGDFTELFYTGPGNPGYFIKNGKVYPNSELDPALAAEHVNHTHLAR